MGDDIVNYTNAPLCPMMPQTRTRTPHLDQTLWEFVQGTCVDVVACAIGMS